MGCEPRGWRSSRISTAAVPYPTGRDGTRPVCPRPENRPEFKVGKADIGGIMPCIVVYVRPVVRDEKLFERFCHATGLSWEADPGDPGYFTVAGHPAALEQLILHKVVHGWHYVIDAREPMAAGAGETKPRAKPKVVHGPVTVAPEYTRKAQGLDS